MSFETIQEILSSGGDIATIALVYVMWKFDRRLLIMETKILNGGKT